MSSTATDSDPGNLYSSMFDSIALRPRRTRHFRWLRYLLHMR